MKTGGYMWILPRQTIPHSKMNIFTALLECGAFLCLSVMFKRFFQTICMYKPTIITLRNCDTSQMYIFFT